MFGYRVPAPDEAMLISGGRRGMNDAPFRVVTGHGAFVTPFVRKVRYLTLSMQEAEVTIVQSRLQWYLNSIRKLPLLKSIQSVHLVPKLSILKDCIRALKRKQWQYLILFEP